MSKGCCSKLQCWFNFFFVFIICRMHSVVARYYHVHTRSTENVQLQWYKTACKSSGYLGRFHFSELTCQTLAVLMRIWFLIKTIQPDQANPKYSVREGDGFSAKTLGKSRFHCQTKWSGNGPVDQFWQMESALTLGMGWDTVNNYSCKANWVEAKDREMFFICSFHFFMSEMFINVSRSSKFY